MIDAAEQEIEDCYDTIVDLQRNIDSPIVTTDTATFEQQQTALKILQATEWARIKYLRWEICKIHEEDENITESEVRSDISQSHPELSNSLDQLLAFINSDSLRITEHHPEFWLQVVTDDTDIPDNNVIILTKYIHDILLTAITPYNEQDLFQWYDHNKEYLKQQFIAAEITDSKRIEHQQQATKQEHRRIEAELLHLEMTRIDLQKTKIRLAMTKRLAKERSEVNRNLPQKQLYTERRRTHSALQAELHIRVEQHARSVAIQAKLQDEQNRLAIQQTLKQQHEQQEILAQKEAKDRRDILQARFGTTLTPANRSLPQTSPKQTNSDTPPDNDPRSPQKSAPTTDPKSQKLRNHIRAGLRTLLMFPITQIRSLFGDGVT